MVSNSLESRENHWQKVEQRSLETTNYGKLKCDFVDCQRTVSKVHNENAMSHGDYTYGNELFKFKTVQSLLTELWSRFRLNATVWGVNSTF